MDDYIWSMTLCIVEENFPENSKKSYDTLIDASIPATADPLEAVEELSHDAFFFEEDDEKYVAWIQLSLHEGNVDHKNPAWSYSYRYRTRTKIWKPKRVDEAISIFEDKLLEENAFPSNDLELDFGEI